MRRCAQRNATVAGSEPGLSDREHCRAAAGAPARDIERLLEQTADTACRRVSRYLPPARSGVRIPHRGGIHVGARGDAATLRASHGRVVSPQRLEEGLGLEGRSAREHRGRIRRQSGLLVLACRSRVRQGTDGARDAGKGGRRGSQEPRAPPAPKGRNPWAAPRPAPPWAALRSSPSPLSFGRTLATVKKRPGARQHRAGPVERR